MIWLSSYPRSGNTFLRNTLFDVYGISSSSYFEGKGEPDNYVEFPVVKTHHMPTNISPLDAEIPSVYLVRDGRDAIVSMAYQQIQIYNSERTFKDIFMEATVASKGSYFGGWGPNVNAWVERADVLIRFEDLIGSPLEQVSRIGHLVDLSTKKKESAPTFEELKFGKPKYGRGKRISTTEEEEVEIIKKSFRKGKAFGWKDELDRELNNFFWAHHRNTMDRMGYDINGGILPLDPDLDFKVMELLGQEAPKKQAKPYKVLIEANKLLMLRNDGVKRYQLELLKALYPLTQNPDSKWQIDLFLKGQIHPLSEYGKKLFDVNKNENNFTHFPETKNLIKQYFKAGSSYMKSWVPVALKDAVKNRYRQLLIKIGLKYSDHPMLKYFRKGGMVSSQSALLEGIQEQEKSILNTYDLIHVPLPQHYEPFKNVKTKFLVTMHDLTHRLFKQYHTSNNIEKAEDGIHFFEKNNAEYICISHNTKADLLAEYQVNSEKLHTIYEAADNVKFKPLLNRDSGLNTREVYKIPYDPFILTLSTLEPRKNLLNTIKAFELLLEENPDLSCNLVIAGNKGWDSKELLKLRHRERIYFTNFINENDLPDLYREAEALCYVSYYEGFGLPPLEAMSCQTPVIYGDNSSMKELFEGYGLPAKSDNVEQIKEQMKAILTNEELKKELGNKALERSFDFSWRKTAIETLEAFEKVITRK